MLTARLLRSRQDRFQISQIDDHVAALETLNETVDQFPDPIDVLLVNIVADRVANFLKENLFGGLRRDATQFFHRQWQQQSVSDFNFLAAELTRFVD